MAVETGHVLFTKLVGLRDAAGERHYERIALADRLLKDHAWVIDPSGGGGDENKAIDRLEDACFGDLCGVIGLPQLLDLYHHVPDRADWKKHKYNLKALWADWKAKQPAKVRPAAEQARFPLPREYVQPSAFPELTPAKARDEYQRVFKAHETDAQKIVRLETENAALKEENARLKAELTTIKTRARELLSA